MTLKDFESEIDPVILERGWDYYSTGAVTNLEEEDAFSWSAFVAGNDDYEVSVFFEEDEIIDWNCDCPYEHGPLCKHVTAVLYAIKANEDETVEQLKSSKPKHKPTNAKKQTDIQQILGQLSETEIKQFLQDQLKTNKELRSKLLVTYADCLPGNREDLYRNLILSSFNRLAGREGFLDYRNASVFSKTVLDLIVKARDKYQDHDLQECLAIIKPIVEEMPDITNSMDDSNGYATLIMEETFALFFELIKETPPQLKDELFVYCSKEFPKKKYRYFGWENKFLQLLSGLISSQKQEDDYIKLIDSQIDQEKKGKNAEWHIPSLLMYKIRYYDQSDQPQKVDAVIMENLHFDKVREFAVERSIRLKEFSTAKKLCLENPEGEKSQTSDRLPLKFLKLLYDIAVIEENPGEERKLAERIFFKSPYEFRHYINLRKSWPSEDWSSKTEEIFQYLNLSENNKSIFNTTILASIYAEEGMIDRLVALMYENSFNLGFVDEFADKLPEIEAGTLLEIYEAGIMKQAEKTGRPAYQKVAIYLLKILKIKGGEDVSRKIAGNLREKYFFRPAMLEILDETLKMNSR